MDCFKLGKLPAIRNLPSLLGFISKGEEDVE
jgi:hypothetical protein